MIAQGEKLGEIGPPAQVEAEFPKTSPNSRAFAYPYIPAHRLLRS